jgi:nucleotide-binding universal stress UspA family protein
MDRMKIRTILVPTDFSECSRAAVEQAAQFAQIFGADIRLLHIMEPPMYGLDFTLSQPESPPGLREILTEKMRGLTEGLRKLGISAEGRFGIGVPFLEILQAAKDQAADLIVMGTHGRTGLAHLLLGSTAERVIQRAHCPVLTVRSLKTGTAEPVLQSEASGKTIRMDEEGHVET